MIIYLEMNKKNSVMSPMINSGNIINSSGGNCGKGKLKKHEKIHNKYHVVAAGDFAIMKIPDLFFRVLAYRINDS